MLSGEREQEASVGARCRRRGGAAAHGGWPSRSASRVSANMALFTLGCRHGLAVCTLDDVREGMECFAWSASCGGAVQGLAL